MCAAGNRLISRVKPSWQFREEIKERRARGAMYAFIALGSQAEGAIGELRHLIEKPTGKVSAALASMALVHLGDSERFVAIAPLVIQDLWPPRPLPPPGQSLYMLETSDLPLTRLQAIEELRWWGEKARFAMPSLWGCLQDKNPEVVIAASNALRQIDPQWLEQALNRTTGTNDK